jgi:hypothetical protein
LISNYGTGILRRRRVAVHAKPWHRAPKGQGYAITIERTRLATSKGPRSKGLTIADVAAATRISERALQAIERERFHLLPGGVFRRTYVQAYAQAVGLDGPACVRAYRQHFEAMEPTGDHDESADWLRSALAILMATMLAAILGLAAVAFA